MYLLQVLIIYAVIGTNIHWHWVEGMAAAGALLGWLVTWAIVEFRDSKGRGFRGADDACGCLTYRASNASTISFP
jgi:hypothetical protein